MKNNTNENIEKISRKKSKEDNSRRFKEKEFTPPEHFWEVEPEEIYADFDDVAPASKLATGSKHAAPENKNDFVKSLFIDVLIAALLAAAVLFFVRPSIVKQTSMLDTLQENDYIIMYQRAYKNHDPERGDIVIFQSDLVNENTGKSKLLIKRVIGLPGDKIKIEDNQLYINGKKYKEDYLRDGITPACEVPRDGDTFTVPDGKYFVMGDNRVVSVDSRYKEVGCISLDQIKGKAVLRLFPFNKITRF